MLNASKRPRPKSNPPSFTEEGEEFNFPSRCSNTHVDEHQVQSYDVLLCPPDQSGTGKVQFASSGHVGNRRFIVFLSMHKQSYDDASSTNNEKQCDDIAAKILRTVCYQCKPRGRFLVLLDDCDNAKDGPRRYYNIGVGDEAHQIIRRALDEPPMAAPSRVTSSGSRRSSVTGSRRSSGVSRRSSTSRRSSDEASRSSEATDAMINTTLNKELKVNLADPRFCVSDVIENSGVFTTGSNLRNRSPNSQQSIVNADNSSSISLTSASDELKRRRRSSLLRRSACDFASIKMACRRRSSAFRGIASLHVRGAGSAAAATTESILTEEGINNSDVLVTGTGGWGVRTTNNLGNNRFRVMIDMARKRYSDAARDEKCRKSIVADIVSNVQRPDADGNPGRFLGVCPEFHKQLQEIPYELALATVRHCLETEPGIDGSTPSVAIAGSHNVTDLRRNAVQDMKKKKNGPRRGGKGFSSSLSSSQIFHQMDRFKSLAQNNKPADTARSAPGNLFEVGDSPASSCPRAA